MTYPVGAAARVGALAPLAKNRLIQNSNIRPESGITRTRAQYTLDLRHARKFTALITMQKTLAGIKPS